LKDRHDYGWVSYFNSEYVSTKNELKGVSKAINPTLAGFSSINKEWIESDIHCADREDRVLNVSTKNELKATSTMNTSLWRYSSGINKEWIESNVNVTNSSLNVNISINKEWIES